MTSKAPLLKNLALTAQRASPVKRSERLLQLLAPPVPLELSLKASEMGVLAVLLEHSAPYQAQYQLKRVASVQLALSARHQVQLLRNPVHSAQPSSVLSRGRPRSSQTV